MRISKYIVCLTIVAVLLGVPTHALRAEPSRPGIAEYRIGMDTELQPELLKNLVHLFDWEAIDTARNGGSYVWGLLSEKNSPYRPGLPLKEQDPELLARIAVRLAGYGDDGSRTLPARKDLTADEAKILKGLIWYRDNDKLEFAHASPLSDADQYLTHLKWFSRAAKIEERMNQPNMPGLPELSYHIHFSVPGKLTVRPTLERFNRLMLMRLINAGDADGLFTGTRFSRFNENLEERGIVRVYGANHFELRRHVLAPEAELADLRRLFLASEEAAQRDMANEFLSLLTKTNLDKLWKLVPLRTLTFLTQNLVEASPEVSRKVVASPEMLAMAKWMGYYPRILKGGAVAAEYSELKRLKGMIDAGLVEAEPFFSAYITAASERLLRSANLKTTFAEIQNEIGLAGLLQYFIWDEHFSSSPTKLRASHPDFAKQRSCLGELENLGRQAP